MPFGTIAANAPSIFVSSPAELEAAYASLSGAGGGTIYLSADFPQNGIIDLNGGGDEPVHITSADPSEPVEVGRILLNNVENLKFSHLHVDSVGLSVPEYQGDVDIDNSSAIVFENMTYTSDGTMYYDPAVSGSVWGGRMVQVNNSSDLTFSDSTVSNYFQAFTFVESSGITVENNDISGIQGDGIKMSGVTNVLIKDNYLHDFAASPNEVFHSDFIQLHSGGRTEIASSDITITGNILDTGNDTSVQGIWLRNEAYNGSNDEMLYRDITITDNLIYTGSANGIGVGAADGVLVANNTVIWNPEAETIKNTGNTSYPPKIRIDEDARNVVVEDNIATGIVNEGTSSISLSGNVIVEYDPSDPNYADAHFVNVADGGDIGPADWQLQSDSPWVGKGANASQPDGVMIEVGSASGSGASGDPVVIPEEEDDPAPADPPAEPEEEETGTGESPGDTGAPSTGTPPNPGTLFEIDFDEGVLVDTSGYDSVFHADSRTSNIVGQDGYEIGGDKMLRLDVRNEQIHNLTSFGFEMEIQLLDPTDTGRFLHFPRAFEASIENDGSVTFTLQTDEGTFSVNSGNVDLDDLEPHTFAVGYDSEAGVLSMVIDDYVVGKTAASGQTSDAAHHGLTVGSIWGDSVNAIVDDIFLGTDPLDAGVDLSLEVGESYEAPAGEPPAEDDPTGDTDPPDAPGVPEPEIPIDPAGAFFAMEFEDDEIADLSSYDSRIKSGDADNIVDLGDGHGYMIGQGSKIALHKSADQMDFMDGFGLRIDMQLLDTEDVGRFLHFPRVFEASVEEDRSVTFQLRTDEGTFTVNSGAVTLDDLEMHSFAVGYDSADGRLTMEIDGTVVDSVAASGTTDASVHHGMTVGSIWGDSLEAIVDNVWIGDSAAAVGVDTQAGLAQVLLNTAVEVPEDPAYDTDFEDDLALAS